MYPDLQFKGTPSIMVGKPEQQQEEAWPQKKAADLMAASVRKLNANKKWVPDTKHCTRKVPPPTRPHLHNLLLKQHHQPGINYSTTLVYGGTLHIQTTKVILLYVNKSMVTMAGQPREMSIYL